MIRRLSLALIALSAGFSSPHAQTICFGSSVCFTASTVVAVAPDPITKFSVYSGGITGITCVQPTRQPTSKVWYFAVSPLDGKTPADWNSYFAANPLDMGVAGDVNHPLYPIQNLFNFGSFPFTQAAGWTTPLDGMNIYQGPPGLTIHQSFKDYASLVAGDTGHLHLWPGDEVVVRGRAGVSAGDWNVGGSPGTASPLGGAASKGLVEADSSGKAVHVYIHGDPNFPRPIFHSIGESNFVGIILDGLTPFNQYTGYQTSASSRFFNWGTAQPHDGDTLNINNHIITWRTSPTLTDDVLIDPKGWQRTMIRTAKNYFHSADPLATAINVSPQTSNFTLVQPVATLPTDGQTISVNGVTWTWRNSPSLPTDLQIASAVVDPSTTLLQTTLVSAAASFKASANPLMKVFTSYANSATALNFIYGPSAQPAAGTALTFNGQTWTFVNGTPAANQIQIASIQWETLANAFLAFDAVTNPWGAGVSYASNGSGLLTISKTNGLAGIYVGQSTFQQLDQDSPINLSTWALGGVYGIHTSASASAPSHDNILNDIFVTAWDGAESYSLATAPHDIYPSTGSLGINDNPADTSVPYGTVNPAKVGGPWTAMDWAIIPNFTGISLNGVQIAGKDDTSEYNYCQTVSNSGVWHAGLGISFGQMHDSLLSNVTTAYQTDDEGDLYSSHRVAWNQFKVTNPINGPLAFHPDALQLGVVGTNNGIQHNLVIDQMSLEAPSDPAIFAYGSWVDMDGRSKTLAGGPQGINGNGAIHHDVTVTNSSFVTYACIGISLEVIPTGSEDVENNSVLWSGQATNGGAPGLCTGMPAINLHPRPDTAVTENIVAKNNIAHGYIIGQAVTGAAICPLPSNVTMAGNKIVETNAGGSYHFAPSTYCSDTAAPGTRPSSQVPPSSIFGGGVTYAGTGDPSAAFVAFPASNLTGIGGLYDLHPKVAGPLYQTGAANSLCCNIDGDPRTSPPNIGPY